MHVAYIHQHFSTKQGAAGTRSYEMSRRLIAGGHRVTMICGVNDATSDCFDLTGRVSRLDIDGIDVMCVAESYANKMSFFRRLVAFGRFARTAAKIVSDLDADRGRVRFWNSVSQNRTDQPVSRSGAEMSPGIASASRSNVG